MELEVIHDKPRTGATGAPLVFVHGANHGAWCWERHFMPYFRARGYETVALSLRGHGRSYGREGLNLYTLADYAEDVRRVIGGLSRKPVLIGHSMGGAVVQKLLAAEPEQVQAAVLLASVPPTGMLKDVLRLLFTRNRLFRQLSAFNGGKSAVFPMELFLSGHADDEAHAELGSLLQPESFAASKETLKRVVPRASGAPVPLLIIGSRHDAMISAKSTQATGRFYRTEPVMLERVSHDMMLDPRWSEVAERIHAFLDGKKE